MDFVECKSTLNLSCIYWGSVHKKKHLRQLYTVYEGESGKF